MSSGLPDTTALRPLWLSHHYACDADRCVRLAGAHLCRRCLAMFAGFWPALGLLLLGWELQLGDIALIVGLTALAGIEFLKVVRGQLPYAARRVLFLSPAVGVSLAWLGVSGVRGGPGVPHAVLGATALAVLATLLANGQVVRRARGPA